MPLHPAVAAKELPPAPAPLAVPVIDAHTHLDACGADTPEQVGAAMARAAAVGVTRVVTVGDDLTSSRWAARATDWHADLYAAVGIHPTLAATLDDGVRAEVAALAARERVVAVGETGLDFYWDSAPADVQREAFAWHIALAKDLGKPLMIHDRDAHQAIWDVLIGEGAPDTVVFHCFSGDEEFAQRCVDAGFVLSFAGPVSFTNAKPLARAATVVPAGQLLVETDAPFLTPHPFRGKRNEPYVLPYTVRALAQIRGERLDEFCETVRLATERVYAFAAKSA